MSIIHARSRHTRPQARHIRLVLRYTLVIIAALFAVFPLYWIFISSVLTQHNAMDVTPHFLPDWDWSNYARAWSNSPWIRYFLNSIFIACSTAVLAV